MKLAYKIDQTTQNADSSSRCSPIKAWTTPFAFIHAVVLINDPGVTKTYKLTYESVEVMHALFDKQSAHNRWTLRSSALREMIEYFGPKTEQLDVYAEDDRVTYTSYTEKVSNDKGKYINPWPLPATPL